MTRCRVKLGRRGLTMVEAVVAMVIVGVMLVAAINTVGAARGGENALSDMQVAQSLAQDLLTEITTQAYADATDTAASTGPSAAESATGNRSLFNDVNDYKARTETPPKAKDGSALSADNTWTRTSRVEFLNPTNATAIVATDQGLARITVEVKRRGALRASLVGLRSAGLPATVACALPNGTCTNLAPAHCLAQGGTPGAAGSNCWTTAEAPGVVGRLALVSLWEMNELLGIVASDSVGPNNATLTNGPSFSAGHAGNALALDGVNDYATAPNDPSISLSAAFTTAAWVNLQAIPGPGLYATVLHKGTTTTKRNYFLQVEGGKLSFGFYSTTGALQRFTAGTVNTTSRWYHVASTFDQATSTVSLYVDGALAQSWTTTKTPAVNTNALTIGKSPYGDYLKGKIDDLRIYSRALSSAEIGVLYNGGEP